MDIARVVLELDPRSRMVLREGEVIRESGGQVEVRWADGSAESLRLGTQSGVLRMMMAAQGLRHVNYTAPGQLGRLLESSPAEVFVGALRDRADGATIRQLVGAVEQIAAHVDVANLWERVRPDFERLPDVRWSGSGKRVKYSLAPPTSTSPVVAPEPPAHDEPLPASPDGGHPLGPALPHGGRGRDDTAVLRLLNESWLNTGAIRAPEAGALVAQATPALRLVHAALQTEGDARLPPQWVVEALRMPLASGVALAALDETLLTAVLPRMGAAAIIGLAVPRSSKATAAMGAVERFGTQAVAELLQHAQREALANVRDGLILKAYEVFVRRLLSTESAAHLPVESVLAATGEPFPEINEKRAEWLASVLLTSLESQGEDAWLGLPASSRATLAGRIASSRLDKQSSRTKLMAWIWRVDPASLREAIWWRGVDFDSLTLVATSALGNALDDPDVRNGIVEPTVSQALSAATTRRQVLSVLALPTSLASLLEPRLVRDKLWAALRADPASAAWIPEITRAFEVARLEAELRAAKDLNQALSAERDEAVAKTERVVERAKRAEERLAEAAATSGELRGAQSRQARLDAIRALAGLAAYVDGAVGAQSADRVRARIAQLTAREGLTPIGPVGEVQPYDPRVHDLVGPSLALGESVTVRGLGYTWTGDGDDVVLVRALVEPQQ